MAPCPGSTAALGWHGATTGVTRWVLGEPAGRWVSLHPFLLDGEAYGGLVGSREDVARLLRMHVRDGDLDGTRILEPETARRVREIVVLGRRFDLGLGWFRPAQHRNEHLGGGAGFFDLIRIDLEKPLGIAVMGNAIAYDIGAVAELVRAAADPGG